ncbi:8166_t:CDS:2 [Ambispora leptoticha]|uniref:8166_t:CDS:1 n=1 Tax=Ambispora leptoticha TaxID=144679 RepID=A0A9N9GQH9_9GLOM|nr:8166_t:CDS:2 [Ambispora leptoticha]
MVDLWNQIDPGELLSKEQLIQEIGTLKSENHQKATVMLVITKTHNEFEETSSLKLKEDSDDDINDSIRIFIGQAGNNFISAVGEEDTTQQMEVTSYASQESADKMENTDNVYYITNTGTSRYIITKEFLDDTG